MGLSGTIDSSVYEGLKDVLQRYPVVENVTYEPNSIVKNYADPKTGFNCGWHRDDDHPDLGAVHFQYGHPTKGGDHRQARFGHEVPTEILWAALDRLFEEQIPELIEG